MATPLIWRGETSVNLGAADVAGLFDPQIIGLSNGNILVAWNESSTAGAGTSPGTDIVGKIYSGDGTTVIRDTYQLNAERFSHDEADFDIAATNDGGFILVYVDNNGTSSDIMWERKNSLGDKIFDQVIAAETGEDGDYDNPQVVVNNIDNSSFVTFTDLDVGGVFNPDDDDIRAVRLNSIGTIITSEFDAADNDGDDQVANDAAINTNGALISVYLDADDDTIYLENRSITGGLGNRVTVDSNGNPSDPQVATLTNGNIAVTWRDDSDDVNYAVYNIILGTVVGKTEVDGASAQQPEIVALPSGEFVVVWYQTSPASVTGRKYDANGAGDGSIFTINTGISTSPNVGVTGDGRLLVTWEESDNIKFSIWDPRDGDITTSTYDTPPLNFVDGDDIYAKNAGGTIIGDGLTADNIIGSSSADNISGGAGNDTIDGNAGSDTIVGGSGADSLLGGSSSDSINGGADNDYIDGGREAGSSAADTLNGEAGNDTILGAFGGDLISGGDDNDSLDGGSGNDTISGDRGNDTLLGGSGNDSINGGLGTDSILGGAGDDTIDGGSDKDIVNGGAGNDVFRVTGGNFGDDIDGGDDNDTLDLSGWIISSIAFNVNLGANSYQFLPNDFGANGLYTLLSVENVIGSGNSDTITNSTSSNDIDGGIGDDTIVMSTNAGTDTLDGGAGTDTLITTLGWTSSVVFDFNAGEIQFDGGVEDFFSNIENLTYSGHASVIGDGAANRIENTSTSRNNNIDGGAGADTILGGGGNDTISGGDDEDSLDGGDGVDTVDYAYWSGGGTYDLDAGTAIFAGFFTEAMTNFENIFLGGGDDTVRGELSAANIIQGGGGNDSIIGRGGEDSIFGGTGNDTIVAGAEAELLNGNADFDLLVYAADTTGVEVRLWNNTANGGIAAGDVISNFEGVVGGNGGDFLQGTTQTNLIRGLGGNDTLNGLGGGDTIEGGLGDDLIYSYAAADTLSGQGGNDTLNYAADTTGVDVTLWNNTATGGFATGDVISGFENVIGGDAADKLVGNLGVGDLLRGLGGNDTLNGLGGGDTLEGGLGDDIILSASGADTMYGQGGNDTLNYAADTTGVDVALWNNTATGGFATGDVFGGFENLIGGSGGDKLVGLIGTGELLRGLGGNDTLNGLGGGDTLEGGSGDDMILSGAGVDVMSGQGGNDTLNYAADTTGVEVRLWNNTATGGYATGDVISGFENVVGGSGNDKLVGNLGGNDVLRGLGGNDTLNGTSGDDTLTGGDDADVFVFFGAFGHDVVTDLNVGGAGVARIYGAGAGYNSFSNFDANSDGLINTLDAGLATVNIFAGGNILLDFNAGDTNTVMFEGIGNITMADLEFF